MVTGKKSSTHPHTLQTLHTTTVPPRGRHGTSDARRGVSKKPYASRRKRTVRAWIQDLAGVKTTTNRWNTAEHLDYISRRKFILTLFHAISCIFFFLKTQVHLLFCHCIRFESMWVFLQPYVFAAHNSHLVFPSYAAPKPCFKS